MELGCTLVRMSLGGVKHSLLLAVQLVGVGFAFLRFYLFIFRERGKEGETHQCVVASRAPPAGGLATTQACALTGNRT